MEIQGENGCFYPIFQVTPRFYVRCGGLSKIKTNYLFIVLVLGLASSGSLVLFTRVLLCRLWLLLIHGCDRFGGRLRFRGLWLRDRCSSGSRRGRRIGWVDDCRGLGAGGRRLLRLGLRRRRCGGGRRRGYRGRGLGSGSDCRHCGRSGWGGRSDRDGRISRNRHSRGQRPILRVDARANLLIVRRYFDLKREKVTIECEYQDDDDFVHDPIYF